MSKKKKVPEGMAGVIRFFSEIYMLGREERSGWKLLAAPQESVEDHIVVTAQSTYVLALMEGLNAERAALMALFHDNDEPRLRDLHKLAGLYLPKKQPSLRAMQDQLRALPEPIRRNIMALVKEFKKGKTPEAIVAKDADRLEAALQAKILMEKGYQGAKYWFAWVKARLKTKSAKMVLAEVENMDDFTTCWWQRERERIMKEQKH